MVRDSDGDHPFEQQLSVSKEDIEFELRGHGPVPWADFLMRWSQGEWSERRLVEAVNGTGDFLCYPYGPSGVAPDDVREYELYFERLEAAGLSQIKRPDLLVFEKGSKAEVEAIIARLEESRSCRFSRKIILICGRCSTALLSRSSAKIACGGRGRCPTMAFQ